MSEQQKTFLERLADFLEGSISMGQNSPDEPHQYMSQFDYELAQWTQELRNHIIAAPAAEKSAVFAAEVEREQFNAWADKNGFEGFRESMFAAWEARASLTQPSAAVRNAALEEAIRVAEHWGVRFEVVAGIRSLQSSPAPKQDGWQPIETAPKDGTAVILCWAANADGKAIDWSDDPKTAGVFVQVASWWAADNEWIVYCDMVKEPSLHFKPTHWMPLPPAPQSPALKEGA